MLLIYRRLGKYKLTVNLPCWSVAYMGLKGFKDDKISPLTLIVKMRSNTDYTSFCCMNDLLLG
jgi:hypothetical protein